MRLLFATVLVSAIGIAPVTQALAIGCISGGLVGGAAGHLAHHGIVGAIGGCIAGHELHKRQQREEDERRSEGDQRRYDNQDRYYSR